MAEQKQKSQAEKFRDAARELETDDDEKRFEKMVEKIAKAPPPKSDKTAK